VHSRLIDPIKRSKCPFCQSERNEMGRSRIPIGEEGLVVGDNEPYSVTDASDYTIPIHGEQRDLHHVALEVRQDLVTDEAGQRMWAALFVRLLPQAYQRLIGLQVSK
jgi:predicted N-formylglutamate amidohydrolase